MPVTSYSRTPSNNNAAAPNGAPEGWAPSAVNDTVRQIMTDIVNEDSKGQARVLASVAGTNTITATMTPDLDAYAAGMIVVFTPAGNNTGATTLNIDSLGALDVQKQDGDALASGDLVSGVPAVLVLDTGADDWILLNPMSLATLNVSTTLTYGGVEVGYRNLPQTVDSDNYTFVNTDRGKVIIYSGTGGHTFSINTSVLEVDGLITVVNGGSASLAIGGTATIQWFNGSGTISSGSRTLAVGGVATIFGRTSSIVYTWGTGLS